MSDHFTRGPGETAIDAPGSTDTTFFIAAPPSAHTCRCLPTLIQAGLTPFAILVRYSRHPRMKQGTVIDHMSASPHTRGRPIQIQCLVQALFVAPWRPAKRPARPLPSKVPSTTGSTATSCCRTTYVRSLSTRQRATTPLLRPAWPEAATMIPTIHLRASHSRLG